MSIPLISIIVPIYNAEKYIKRCFECISEQSFENWELILINDGSTDKSLEICQELISKEKRVTLINQKNQGASIARRVGINQARGKYLIFIDCDDLVETNYISTLLNAVLEKQTNIAACGIAKHYETVSVHIPTPERPVLLEQKELFSRFFKYEFWGYVDKIYKREVFDGVYFPKHTINEDYVVMLQLFQKEGKIAYVKTPLYHYLIHPNSLSHQKISKRAIDEYYNKLWAYNFCKNHLEDYQRQAEAQTAETCIKLIAMIKESHSKEFLNVKKEMKSFLRNHFLSILTNDYLLFGLKLNAIKYSLFY